MTQSRARLGSSSLLAGLAVIVSLSLPGGAAAAPHKVLVLPVDGNADAATRARLTARIVKHARAVDGQVATGEATFADTALAVGCDPVAAGCSDLVMATLGVDELVWGTATRDGDRTRLIVRRATRGARPRGVSAIVAANDPADRVDAEIAPLFGPPGASSGTVATTPPTSSPGGSPEPASPAGPPIASPPASQDHAPSPPPPGGPEDHRDRNLGITLTASGGVALVLGLALLASYSSLQGSIDSHATRTRADFTDLTALEDRARNYAIAGDFLVVAGLTAGGFGAYYLYRDHHRHRVAVAPALLGHGAMLTLTITGAP